MIRILAIDDKKDNLISLGAILKDIFSNSKVYSALSGPDGIELAIAIEPDVILLDILMPEMDGFEVCRILKVDDRTKDIPIIFLTAMKDDKNSRIKALEIGAEAFLSKPIDESELTAQIRAMVKINEANRNIRNEKQRLAKLVDKRTSELVKSQKSTLQLLDKLKIENKIRKQKEEELETAIQHLRFHEDNSPLAIIEFDQDNRIINWSENASTIFGWKKEEVLNKQVEELNLIHIDDIEKVAELQSKMYGSNKSSSTLTNRNIRKDGSIIVCEWYNSALLDTEGNLISVQALILDITNRKLAEKELIEAKEKAEESDRLKSAFLANMSHEIRTPMNGILGFAELLKEPDLSGEQQHKYIGIIEKSGTRMLNIINDIVSISKIESGQMELVFDQTNINEQIKYLYSFFKLETEKKGINLSYIIPSNIHDLIIKTDVEKLYAILTNIIKNAIKYTESGKIEFGYTIKNNQISFFIKDTGIGIPQIRQKAIFERFIQADVADKMAKQGAGLGLSIAAAYIELLKGEIWLESEVGIGSSFFFTIPIQIIESNIIATENQTNNNSDIHSSLKILVVEDDKTSEELINIYVEPLCKEIINVNNGINAVDFCKSTPDIDIVLMDIQLPEMGGLEATKLIRDFNKDVIIIAQTAYALEGDKEKAIEAGCNDYISKPLNTNKLIHIISKYF